VSVAARTDDRVQARRAALAGVHVGTTPLLAAIVAASFVVRTILAWLRATPTFFSDEYIYSELGRSIAETGRPLIRGASAHFPALLQPILTAPAWLVEEVETSFRLVQVLGALAMSLAAVPIFLLARRLGLAKSVSLALAALAVAVPDMLYSSWIVAEPFAYPLALGAVAAATAALSAPRRGNQLAFLLLAGLAAFARLQFAVLPACFVAALLVVGIRERRLRKALREQILVLGALLLPLAALVLAGPRRALGFYEGVLDVDALSPALAKWLGADALVLAFASGWVLVPGAVLGLVLVLHRPRSRAELAFGALGALVIGAVLLEAAVYGLQGERVHERYFFYAVPLVGLLFALYARRGWPHKLAHALLAAGLVAVSAQVPLSGFVAAEGKTNSPVLFATAYLERRLEDVGLASLLVAAAVGATSAAVVLATRRGRGMTGVALALALAVMTSAYAGAVAFGLENARSVRDSVLSADPSFVDHTGARDVALLHTRHSDRGLAMEALFWNHSVDRAVLLPGGTAPDTFQATQLTVARDGTLLAFGRPVTGALLVDAYSDTLRLHDAPRVLGASLVYRLLAGGERKQLALYAPGRSEDGWLAQQGSFRLWPESAGGSLAGRLTFTLSGARDGGEVPVGFRLPKGERKSITVPARGSSRVDLPVCSSGPWVAAFTAPLTGTVGDRFVSLRASEPVYTPDPSACA
jgi:hypothetical protein